MFWGKEVSKIFRKKNCPQKSVTCWKRVQVEVNHENGKNVLKRMRWKALTFLGKLKSSEKDNYGFKT